MEILCTAGRATGAVPTNHAAAGVEQATIAITRMTDDIISDLQQHGEGKITASPRRCWMTNFGKHTRPQILPLLNESLC